MMLLEKTRHYFNHSTRAKRTYITLEPWQEAALEWTDQELKSIACRDHRSVQWLAEQLEIAVYEVSTL